MIYAPRGDTQSIFPLQRPNNTRHNFLQTTNQNDAFFIDLRKYLPANVHHPSHNVHHIAPKGAIYQKMDSQKTILSEHNNSVFQGSFERRIRMSVLKRSKMHHFRKNDCV